MTIEDKINEFIENLDNLISDKISDATADPGDSMAGCSSYHYKKELRDSLCRLFNVEVEVVEEDEEY